MEMMNKLFYVLCLVISTIGHIVEGHTMFKEDFELEKQLNLVNKTPIKSIHAKSGYIVDCVDINKQPAFDHPLLKNHILQQKPSFETSVKIFQNKPGYALEKVECPQGTVPIRRITKDNLIQGKKLFSDHILDQNNTRSYSAHAYLRKGEDYFGASGITSVYNPKVSMGQTSASALYVQNGEGDGANKIVVGWNVSPRLYNNDGTHIFSLWTSDNFKSGCYNTMCPGFVQTDSSYYLGSRIEKTSIIGNPDIVDLSVSISKDEKTQNWWLSIQSKAIGYFPAQLFSNLNNANEVGWGGLAISGEGVSAPDPPMGSGNYPDFNVLHSAYFRHIQFVNHIRQDIGPQNNDVETSNNGKCYRVKYLGYRDEPEACILLFGGPGTCQLY